MELHFFPESANQSKNRRISRKSHNPTIPQSQTTPTESGTIRLIVWQGAFKAFKNRPILGWGPETFAYSYYLFRPNSHNQTTEWNFFYNKAHNEFLNYLTNTGILGFSAYISFLIIILFIFFRSHPSENRSFLFAKAALGSIIGYQITIFFGFSTVTTQLLMFLLIPTTLILIGKTNIKTVRFNLINSMQNYIASFILFILALAILSYPTRMYFADILYERAKNLESKNMAGALLAYTNAVEVFPANNPFYLADSAYKMAVYTESIDKTEKSDEFIKKAVSLANAAQKLSPENIIITRRVANSYLLLSEINEEYVKSALENGEKLTLQAPNDPQSFLTLAKIQTGVGKEEDATRSLETALALKPDYLEARELLEQLK